MGFKWSDPNVRLDGEGSLKDYFSAETWSFVAEGEPITDPALKKLDEEMNDRGSAIDRLQLQLFTEFSGVSPDEVVSVRWIDYDYDLRLEYAGDVVLEDDEADKPMIEAYEAEIKRNREAGGLNLVCVQSDDPIVALYRDGKPLAAFYASYRGMYQAGAYSAITNTYYFASDFVIGEPHNEWINDGQEEGRICAKIAHDFLLGLRA